VKHKIKYNLLKVKLINSGTCKEWPFKIIEAAKVLHGVEHIQMEDNHIDAMHKTRGAERYKS